MPTKTQVLVIPMFRRVWLQHVCTGGASRGPPPPPWQSGATLQDKARLAVAGLREWVGARGCGAGHRALRRRQWLSRPEVPPAAAPAGPCLGAARPRLAARCCASRPSHPSLLACGAAAPPSWAEGPGATLVHSRPPQWAPHTERPPIQTAPPHPHAQPIPERRAPPRSTSSGTPSRPLQRAA